MIIRYTFPIPNYEGNGIFEKHVYLEAKRCPTKEELKDLLTKLHEEEMRDVMKLGGYPEYKDCLDCLNNICENSPLPIVGIHVVETNTFCNTNFGRQPLVVKIINPIPFPRKALYCYQKSNVGW